MTFWRYDLLVDEIELTKAAQYLGISRNKMWKIAKSAIIPHRIDPLDSRKKLFRKRDLDRLKRGEIFAQENAR